MVFSWHKEFKDRETSSKDKHGRERKMKRRMTLTTSFRDFIWEDRRFTVWIIEDTFDLIVGIILYGIKTLTGNGLNDITVVLNT